MAQEHLCSLYRGITSCGMRSQVEDGKRSVTSVHVYGVVTRRRRNTVKLKRVVSKTDIGSVVVLDGPHLYTYDDRTTSLMIYLKEYQSH